MNAPQPNQNPPPLMRLEGFAFRDNIYLQTQSGCFDLRNFFDFTGFAYDVSTRTLTLCWIPNEYGSNDEHRRIHVEFQGVHHLSIEPRDPSIPFTEDDCMSSVYPMPFSKVGDAEGFDHPDGANLLEFCFMSKMRLQVHAQIARVTLEKT
jgi:hypothetical protein